MNNDRPTLPDISGYIKIIDSFLHGESTASRFEDDYLDLFQYDGRMIGEPLFPLLNDIFFALEDYVPDPELRTEDTDIDEEEMTRRVRQARAELAALLNEG